MTMVAGGGMFAAGAADAFTSLLARRSAGSHAQRDIV